MVNCEKMRIFAADSHSLLHHLESDVFTNP